MELCDKTRKTHVSIYLSKLYYLNVDFKFFKANKNAGWPIANFILNHIYSFCLGIGISNVGIIFW